MRSERTLCSDVYVEVQCSQLSQERTTSGIYCNSAVYCILEMVPTNCSSSSLNFYIHIIIVYTDIMYLFDLVGTQKRKKFQCASLSLSLLKQSIFFLILVVSTVWADYFNNTLKMNTKYLPK